MIITTHWLDLLLDYLPGPKQKKKHTKKQKWKKIQETKTSQNKRKYL